ncbi:MAG: site-specific integrase [Bacteroides sp.]|nr:site-specific integrase [Bacteroides sp.]
MAKKRANGEGSLRRKENGHWEIQIMDGFKPDGRRKIVSFTCKTQKEAKRMRDEYLRMKADGLLTGADLRFDEWAPVWFANHMDNIKPTTQESYKYTLRILTDHFGRRKLAEIRPMDIEQFLMKLRKDGRSDSALAQCRGMLYQIFRKAAANDMVPKNPVEYADKMRKRPPRRKEVFTADEVRYLMKNLPDNKIGWSIRLLLSTGMRSQELLALEPRHIARDGSSINIEQAVVMEKGTAAIGTPKSYDSYRTIPVPEMARYCAVLLRDTDKRFVWESPKKPGCPCNPSHFRTQFRKTLESMEGVRLLTPHCCRHTYVSQLQALGVSVETIQSIVGHADIDMTKHYLHVQESIRQDAVQRFSEAFSKTGRGVFGNVLDYKKSS